LIAALASLRSLRARNPVRKSVRRKPAARKGKRGGSAGTPADKKLNPGPLREPYGQSELISSWVANHTSNVQLPGRMLTTLSGTLGGHVAYTVCGGTLTIPQGFRQYEWEIPISPQQLSRLVARNDLYDSVVWYKLIYSVTPFSGLSSDGRGYAAMDYNATDISYPGMWLNDATLTAAVDAVARKKKAVPFASHLAVTIPVAKLDVMDDVAVSMKIRNDAGADVPAESWRQTSGTGIYVLKIAVRGISADRTQNSAYDWAQVTCDYRLGLQGSA